MQERELNLTEQEQSALREIARRTGKTESELVSEAVGNLIGEFQTETKRSLMRQAKGIWKDRNDVPALETLRSEWDRF